MTMSVIDLGDIKHLPDEPKSDPRVHRGIARFRIGRLAKAATAVLTVLALGGSALPGPPVLREVWSTAVSDTESWSVDQDAVYVHRARGGRTELTEYESATGEVRWTHPVATGPSRANVTARHGVLLLPKAEQSIDVDGGAPARVVTATQQDGLTVLRYADGTPLASGSVPWRPTSYATRSGSYLSAVDGRLVVVDLVLETSGDLIRVAVYRAGDLGHSGAARSRDTRPCGTADRCSASRRTARASSSRRSTRIPGSSAGRCRVASSPARSRVGSACLSPAP
ncbi:hypothetical protein Ait01nite_097380 [Actinoplanes italicus]|uniref:Uncharacterized protein n=1 Tax=Actinoplanes italicus TaxID=113567 RepID=A0A2T0JLW0_9ACTN|nr:hypothetical protein [Actinoplanes italicus]PRX08422.1 hypothetical protein CLV67_14021 [Actinoplanes italicus]GIE36693.1 hypothetical protein Ait01nite_097380 [Actinoplanes italicus]